MAVCLGYRAWPQLRAVILVNLITHPALHYFILICRWEGFVDVSFFTIVVLELVVIVAEWLLLVYVLRGKRSTLFALSLSMNATSFIAGLIVF